MPKHWRAGLLALCGFSAACLAASILSGTITASEGFDFTLVHSKGSPVSRVAGVKAGSPAARAGLRDGDVLQVRQLSPAVRYRLTSGVAGHERLTLVVSHDGVTRTVIYTSGPSVPLRRWDLWLFYAGMLWMLLFAALIAWRRPESAEAHVLCLLLVFFVVPSLFQPGNWASPWPLADFVVAMISVVVSNVSIVLLATYSLLFARPASALRRWLAWLAYVVAAVSSVYAIAGGASVVFGAGMSGASQLLSLLGFVSVGSAYAAISSELLTALTWLLPVLCVLATIPAVKGAERARVVWTTLTLGVLYTVELATLILAALVPAFAAGHGFNPAIQIDDAAIFVAPIGMTYALFNRRLLDLGFAVNRAAIFAGVSFVLVGVFVLVEWLLSDWLQTASHSANLAVTGVLALALGLSIRFVHARVEHVVDNVFFRKRREDEEAIRRLAREAPYITDGQTLLERVTAVLSKHGDASSVQILLDGGSGTYSGVNENDPALVALRAERDVLDLHTVETNIGGEFAYPMVARGRLLGVLVLGLKRSGESYAPDESSAITQLAQSVAAALDVLGAKRVDGTGVSLQALYEAVQALPEAIRTSLRDVVRESNEA